MWMFCLVCSCGLILVWTAQWLDWQAGLQHPSLRIRTNVH